MKDQRGRHFIVNIIIIAFRISNLSDSQVEAADKQTDTRIHREKHKYDIATKSFNEDGSQCNCPLEAIPNHSISRLSEMFIVTAGEYLKNKGAGKKMTI